MRLRSSNPFASVRPAISASSCCSSEADANHPLRGSGRVMAGLGTRGYVQNWRERGYLLSSSGLHEAMVSM